MAIDSHYEALLRDNKFLLVPSEYVFVSSYTTTEVKVVQALSAHHKMCYMMLKYCLNNIIIHTSDFPYQPRFSLYFLKTFILRHAERCKVKDNKPTSENSYMCIMDVFFDIQRNVNGDVDGIYNTFEHRLFRQINALLQQINNIIKALHQIGQAGKTPCNS